MTSHNKTNIRWQLLLAAACFALILAILSFQIQTASLCTVRVPASGGYMVEGIVGAPRYLNPLLADDNPVDRDLSALLFDGLTRFDPSGKLVPALAESWEISDDGLTVSFLLRDDAFWHDGQPLSAQDVIFTYQLMQDEAFPGSKALQTLWSTVVITTEGDRGVQFQLPEPFAPFLAATTRGLLPSHILEGVSAQALVDHEFNRFPIGTGLFRLDPGSDWSKTGRLLLQPVEGAWFPDPQVDGVEFRFYPHTQALQEAFERGEVQAISRATDEDIETMLRLEGMRLYSAPAPSYTQLLFNLNPDANSPIVDLALRQALAIGTDRSALVDEALSGQGVFLEGPYLPSSWAYNPSQLTERGYQPLSATAMIEAAGWQEMVSGQAREKDGASLELRLVLADTPRMQAVAQELVDQWADLGATVILEPAAPGELTNALSQQAFDVALVEVAPGDDPDLYDFWSQEAIVRGQNYAYWNNRRASEALENARQLYAVSERMPYYDTFLRQFDQDLPALTLFQHVDTYGLAETMGEVEIGRIDNPRDRYQSLPAWTLLFREITVSCLAEEAG